jgi:histone H3/H4
MSDRDVVDDDGSEAGGSGLSDGEGDGRFANDDDKNAGEKNADLMTDTDAAAAAGRRAAEGMDDVEAGDGDDDDDDEEDNAEENDVEEVGDGGQAHAKAEEDEDEEDGDEPSTSTSTSTVADGDQDDAASDADADHEQPGNAGTPHTPSSRKSSEALTESPADERNVHGAQEEEGDDDDEEEDEAEDDDDDADGEEDPNDEEGKEGGTATADDEDGEGVAPSSSGRGGAASASAHNSKKSRIPAVSGLTIPFRTVKKAMKLDPDIPIVQNEAAVMVTIAAELFLKSLARESLVSAAKRSRSTIKYEDVAEARTKRPALSFLEPVLP